MEITVSFWNRLDFLPSKRHRRLRSAYQKKQAVVPVAEPSEKEFPVAFVVKEHGLVYEKDDKSQWGELRKEIRTYNGKLYQAVRYSEKMFGAAGWLPPDYLPNLISLNDFRCKSDPLTDTAIIEYDDTEMKMQALKQKARDYVVFDGRVWQACGEPMYVVNTFGLGHNHGGTGMFICQWYNPNIRKDCYFTALERDKAVAFAKEVALGRGDTDSVDRMGDDLDIEVLMPEMVRRNPQEEHGDGDPFMNKLESLIRKSDSKEEAALLTIFSTIKEVVNNP